MASSVVSPLRNAYRYLVRHPPFGPLVVLTTLQHAHPRAYTQQCQAHEFPVLFYSVVLGFVVRARI
jgi:hypothetical protein